MPVGRVMRLWVVLVLAVLLMPIAPTAWQGSTADAVLPQTGAHDAGARADDVAAFGGANGRADDVAAFGGANGSVVHTILATASEDLLMPRDLEFHPVRTQELWVVNRADDSVLLMFDAGLVNQTTERRKDSNANHFMEEVAAIAFGDISDDHGHAFATAQETRNTFDGQAAPNNFMGPALWPSRLDEFARVHQSRGPLLGSHIDMQHESPLGMGVAHDSGNKYWYFDGYYSTLVYYDFAMDHDTGHDDHSDGVVRRYTEVVLTRVAGVPGHMVLDDRDGMLYIADTGTGRVLWVDTDAPVTLTPTTYGQMETLDEYSNATNASFGTLVSGLDRPTGVALDGDTLYVSTHGDATITAYDLNGTELGSVQTPASDIGGLEIGPDGHLWYVDWGNHTVVRMDPDADGDGHSDLVDLCPGQADPTQSDLDGDGVGDVCDTDADADGVPGVDDLCPLGVAHWVPTPTNDHDADGCRDADEDDDDDGDGSPDGDDACELGDVDWHSNLSSDHDGDGCRDASSEDVDDDGDGICDALVTDEHCQLSPSGADRCQWGPLGWSSTVETDHDRDGCADLTDDLDDDDDGVSDVDDTCPKSAGSSTLLPSIGCPDSDGDGMADAHDGWPTDPSQWSDSDHDGWGDAPNGTDGDACPQLAGASTLDRAGCPDRDLDGVSDPDEMWTADEGADAFPLDFTQWNDTDGDGHGDNWANASWSEPRSGSWPGVWVNGAVGQDACPLTPGTSWLDLFGCPDTDGDGWSDANDRFPADASQAFDGDRDGFGSNARGQSPDACVTVAGTSSEGGVLGCPDADGDGWADSVDDLPAEASQWVDADGDGFGDQEAGARADACPTVAGSSTEDRFGCPDADGDGHSDGGDEYPAGATRHAAAGLFGTGVLVSLAALAVALLVMMAAIGGALRFRARGSEAAGSITERGGSIGAVDAWPTQPVLPSIAPPIAPSGAIAGPPEPEEGLPPGWSPEQWAYYGEGWLEQHGRA